MHVMRHAESAGVCERFNKMLQALSLPSVMQIQLDFAAMQRDDPKLVTLKDFVMSSNQAPDSPSDVLRLLQAFADFEQGAL